MTGLTIGKLSREAGVPTSTVRYYERRGLLTPKSRSGGNYRMYDEAACDRLHFIKAAQSAGFTLADIGTLIKFSEGATPPCRDVQALIEQRLSTVDDQIERLLEVKGALSGWLSACESADNRRRCDVLDGLNNGRSSSSDGVAQN